MSGLKQANYLWSLETTDTSDTDYCFYFYPPHHTQYSGWVVAYIRRVQINTNISQECPARPYSHPSRTSKTCGALRWFILPLLHFRNVHHQWPPVRSSLGSRRLACSLASFLYSYDHPHPLTLHQAEEINVKHFLWNKVILSFIWTLECLLHITSKSNVKKN